jgi:predicted MFS family arabinose efflux permease
MAVVPPSAVAEVEVSPSWLRPFLAFAGAYFLAALLRAVTATLAPAFSQEFQLNAANLGLLGGAYFFGFALMQLPLGVGLDRWGPRRVEAGLLLLAIAGCALFALAEGFVTLVLARMLIGMGVSACLMSPLTHFRHHYAPALQLRCNSWMLMTGSLGMVASTMPVQWLLPTWGWRGLFAGLAGALALAAVGIWLGLSGRRPDPRPTSGAVPVGRYGAVIAHAEFVRMAPMGLILYGGMIAMQALWIGPWLTQVSGWQPATASQGLLLVNVGMLLAFLTWGAVMPVLSRLHIGVTSLLTWGVPCSLVLLAVNVYLGAEAGAVHWMAWCVATSVVSLSQPAIAHAFPVHMAGRALSAYNLAVFVGVFLLQWLIGVSIDALQMAGLGLIDAFRATLAGFLLLSTGTYLWFLSRTDGLAHNRDERSPS